jgi:hypothetical protein
VGKFVHDDRDDDLYYRLCGQACGGLLRHSLDQLLGLGGGLSFGGEGELNQAESDRLVVGVAQFVEVEALDLGAVEEGLVDGGVGGFEATAGEDQDAVPVVVEGLVAVQVQEGFGEEAVVDAVVFLKLNFGEDDVAGGGVGGGQEYAVDAEGGFFDFYGVETVAALLDRDAGGDLEDQVGVALVE